MHQVAVKSTKVANSFEVVSHFSFLIKSFHQFTACAVAINALHESCHAQMFARPPRIL